TAYAYSFLAIMLSPDATGQGALIGLALHDFIVSSAGPFHRDSHRRKYIKSHFTECGPSERADARACGLGASHLPQKVRNQYRKEEVTAA
ncbi:MAG TPA: hypothetical protein VE604_11825, partial [Candidatus Polarisedimenticolia bacterium]|nr:hypothetical protein [Candidatus Polarisedimenticolia bacterium]